MAECASTSRHSASACRDAELICSRLTTRNWFVFWSSLIFYDLIDEISFNPTHDNAYRMPELHVGFDLAGIFIQYAPDVNI
jgi:hypothetical protein